MKLLFILLVLGALIFWGYSVMNDQEAEPAAESAAEPTEERSEGSSGILADYVGANIQARDSADRTTSLAGLNQTIRQFQTIEGRYPEALEELVTEGYLTQLPSPPRREKFEYDAENGTVTTVPE